MTNLCTSEDIREDEDTQQHLGENRASREARGGYVTPDWALASSAPAPAWRDYMVNAGPDLDTADRVGGEHLERLFTLIDGLRMLAGPAIAAPLEELRGQVSIDMQIMTSHAREAQDQARRLAGDVRKVRSDLAAAEEGADQLKKQVDDMANLAIDNARDTARVWRVVEGLEQYVINLGRRGVISKSSARSAAVRAYREADADA